LWRSIIERFVEVLKPHLGYNLELRKSLKKPRIVPPEVRDMEKKIERMFTGTKYTEHIRRLRWKRRSERFCSRRSLRSKTQLKSPKNKPMMKQKKREIYKSGRNRKERR
jgi:hypothetical protein